MLASTNHWEQDPQTTHMLKLGRVRPLDVHQRPILFHDALLDQAVHLRNSLARVFTQHPSGTSRTHASQVLLDVEALEITAAEHDRAKVLSNGLMQTLGRRQSHGHIQRGIVVEPVTVDANLLGR